MSNLPEHFIDTSIARGQFFGTQKYRLHLSQKIGPGKQYISDYIVMEFRRSFLVNAIRFLQLLDLPTVTSFSDALLLWSHKFKGSEHKAVYVLMAKMIELEDVGFSLNKELSKVKIKIVEYLKEFDRRFIASYEPLINSGTDCKRAVVKFDIRLDHYEEDLEKFLENFNNTRLCQKRCSITKMLLHTKQSEVNTYVKNIPPDPKSNDEKKFAGVATNLQKVQKKHSSATCFMCGYIGDSVITLDCPSRMRLHHADASFNMLCDLIGQEHKFHLSEPGFHASQAAASTTALSKPTTKP